MAGSEPVTSPDQHKPGHRKAGRIGARACSVAGAAGDALRQPRGQGRGHLADRHCAVLLLAIVIGDVVLRRNGLRS